MIAKLTYNLVNHGVWARERERDIYIYTAIVKGFINQLVTGRPHLVLMGQSQSNRVFNKEK